MCTLVIVAMHGKFEVFHDKAGEYRFRLKASNGQIIAVSQAYKSRAACMKGIESVKANAAEAPVEELAEPQIPS